MTVTYRHKTTGETRTLTETEAERFFDNRDPGEWTEVTDDTAWIAADYAGDFHPATERDSIIYVGQRAFVRKDMADSLSEIIEKYEILLPLTPEERADMYAYRRQLYETYDRVRVSAEHAAKKYKDATNA